MEKSKEELVEELRTAIEETASELREAEDKVKVLRKDWVELVGLLDLAEGKETRN